MKLLAAACVLVILAAGPLAAADFERDLQAALGPYYAALVASSRGNIDQTQRQLLLFASRWQLVARDAGSNAPAALRNDPQWTAFLRHVETVQQQVRESLRLRNLTAVHAQLESIRLMLREIDARHNRSSLDDALTDFHDAMERMIGHVAGVNEIVLRPKDFDDIREDYDAACESWKAVQAQAGPIAATQAWRAAFDDLARTLDAVGRELPARRPEPLAASIQGMHDKYYVLLLAVARARG
jgi:hypothetical protein